MTSQTGPLGRSAKGDSSKRILLLSASLTGGIPNLPDTVTRLDDDNVARLVTAIRHATGKRAVNTRYR
jgi:hypothetical protein